MRQHASEEDRARLKGERQLFWRVLAWSCPLTLLIFLAVPNLGPVFRIFSVPSQSMAPNLPTGTILVVSRSSYGYSRASFDLFPLPIRHRWPAGLDPRRGDVIMFRQPSNQKNYFIKRVIGLPGDRIAIAAGVVSINAEPARYTRRKLPAPSARGKAPNALWLESRPRAVPHLIYRAEGASLFANMPPVTVPHRHVYVLGDNRPNSLDSRHPSVGMIPMELILGRVVWHSGPNQAPIKPQSSEDRRHTMSDNQMGRAKLIGAVEAALDGRWEEAHTACQNLEGDKTADWLHAVLHKIEGDEPNSRYWYRRSGQSYESWPDPTEELKSIKAVLTY